LPKTICVRRRKNALDVSYNGGVLPADLNASLRRQLVYTYVQTLHGKEAYTEAGDYVPVRTEAVDMYRFGRNDRLLCPAGFRFRIFEEIERHGFELDYQDSTPPSPRKRAFEVDLEHCVANFEFKERQDEMLAAMIDNECGVLVAAAGFGKSYGFAAFCLAYRWAKIAIVIPGLANVRKTYSHLCEYLPSVGMITGTEKSRGRVTVCSADSMHHLDEEEIDILIVDEVHALVSDKHAESLAQITGSARCFGFTATPEGRKDGTDIRIEAIFGRQIFSIRYAEARDMGLVLPIVVNWHNVHSRYNPIVGSDGSRMMGIEAKRFGIWRNEFRNQAIANVARSIPAKSQHLIMCDALEHVLHLHEMLPHYSLMYSTLDRKKQEKFYKMGLLPEDYVKLTEVDREEMYKDFRRGTLKKVISTNCWSQGVSFEQLARISRADARNGSEIYDEQLPGRVDRLDPDSGKQIGELDDFVDLWDEGFKRAGETRKRIYRKKGYEQRWPNLTGRQKLLFVR